MGARLMESCLNRRGLLGMLARLPLAPRLPPPPRMADKMRPRRGKAVKLVNADDIVSSGVIVRELARG